MNTMEEMGIQGKNQEAVEEFVRRAQGKYVDKSLKGDKQDPKEA